MEIKTYRDTGAEGKLPFLESVDTAFFFSGAGRRDAVDEIKAALSRSIPLVTLIGPEGAGKSMLCKVVETELPPTFISVYLPKAINSFDEMAEIVLKEIGFIRNESLEEQDPTQLLTKVVTFLQEREIKLVVFFDEAEKIYLATLERVRKLLDRANSEKIVFQFVFSGRESFQDNLQQLSIVTLEDAEEHHLEIGLLDVEEAYQYLNHCSQIATGDQRETFSHDLVSKVASNGVTFKRLNSFAQELFQANELDTSFLGLIDTEQYPPQEPELVLDVEESVSSPEPGSREVNLDFLSFKKLLPGPIVFGGALFVVIATVLLWFNYSREDSEQPEETVEVPIIELKRVVPLAETDNAALGEDPAPQEEEAEETIVEAPQVTVVQPEVAVVEPEVAVEQPEVAVVQPVVTPDSQKEPALVEQVVEELREEGGEQEVIEEAGDVAPAEVGEPEQDESQGEILSGAQPTTDSQDLLEVVVEEASESEAEEQPDSLGQAIDQEEKPEVSLDTVSPELAQPEDPEPAVVERSEPPPAESEQAAADSGSKVMVEPLEEKDEPFSPEMVKETRLPDVPRLPEPVILYSDEKKYKESRKGRKKATQEQVTEKQDLQVLTAKEVDALFLRRIAAGARWLVGGGSGKYTVQLMVLTSGEAEQSLKQMLRTVEYQSLADELYLLRRTGPDPTVMVFYGEFPTLAAARKSRNNLPVFLRKHNPYAISVFGAVEKATAPQ